MNRKALLVLWQVSVRINEWLRIERSKAFSVFKEIIVNSKKAIKTVKTIAMKPLH